MPSGKALDHVSLYGTDLSDEDHAENMCQMFVNLPAEVITQGVCVYICSDILNYQGNSKIQNLKICIDQGLNRGPRHCLCHL